MGAAGVRNAFCGVLAALAAAAGSMPEASAHRPNPSSPSARPRSEFRPGPGRRDRVVRPSVGHAGLGRWRSCARHRLAGRERQHDAGAGAEPPAGRHRNHLRMTGGNTALLVRVSDSQGGAMQLDPVRVQAALPPPTATIGNLPPVAPEGRWRPAVAKASSATATTWIRRTAAQLHLDPDPEQQARTVADVNAKQPSATKYGRRPTTR